MQTWDSYYGSSIDSIFLVEYNLHQFWMRSFPVFYSCLGGWGWTMLIGWFAWSWIASTFYERCISGRYVGTFLILNHINLFDLNAPKILILTFIYLSIFCKACSQKEVVGILVFSGSVCSFACLNPKEPISQALADIKVLNSYHFQHNLWLYFENVFLLEYLAAPLN